MKTITPLTAGETTFSVTFEWDDETMGFPGAFIIKNHHHSQFYLKTVTLDDVPCHGRVHFVCNSWVYPAHRYKYDRVFFSNKVNLIHLQRILFFLIWTDRNFDIICSRPTFHVKHQNPYASTGKKNWSISEEKEKESSKNGTESMIMNATMTWQCRKGVYILNVRFLANRRIVHIPEEGEQVGNLTKKVNPLNLLAMFDLM